MRKRWQFSWCDENSPPKNGDSHDWRSKTFYCATFEKAMDKMVDFIYNKPFACLVDYECVALHVPYNSKRHTDRFYRIDNSDHELKDYMG